MASNNIQERRAYIKQLLNQGVHVGEKIRDIAKEWNSSFPAIVNDISMISEGRPAYTKDQTTGQNTRARKFGEIGEITSKQWHEILKQHNFSCAICGSKDDICIDHIIPLSRGGTNTKDNIEPLCRSCNSKKGNSTETQKATSGRHRKS
jgi:5-methylcytosine-specific restriction endonuclease McrA